MIDDNDHFKMSLEEKKELKNAISNDLQKLVMIICAMWEDKMSSSLDYNEFGDHVQYFLELAMERISYSYLCGYAWGLALKWGSDGVE